MTGLEVGVATLGLAFLAGLVTTLSPCVLPILPMVAAAATGRSAFGLVALAAGMASAFTVVGVLLASGGQLLGAHEGQLRIAAGALMLGLGIVLLSSRIQQAFARASSGVGRAGYQGLSRLDSGHPAAQFGVGALLGVAWSPCVGPTLGAAIALAASGGGLLDAAVVMGTFSLAAVVPLTTVGLLSRGAFMRHRERMARASDIGRKVMGWSLAAIGALVLSGYDKVLEAWLLDRAPDWLLDITTRF